MGVAAEADTGAARNAAHRAQITARPTTTPAEVTPLARPACKERVRFGCSVWLLTPRPGRPPEVREGRMRRVLVAAVIAMAAVALYATTAPAGQQAVTPKQFAALTKRVAKLEKDNKDIKNAI